MRAGFMAERSHRSIDAGKPQIRRDVYMPTLNGRVRRVGLLRSSQGTLRLRARVRYTERKRKCRPEQNEETPSGEKMYIQLLFSAATIQRLDM